MKVIRVDLPAVTGVLTQAGMRTHTHGARTMEGAGRGRPSASQEGRLRRSQPCRHLTSSIRNREEVNSCCSSP